MRYRVTAKSGLNVRAMPDADSEIYFALKHGDTFLVPDGWLPVLLEPDGIGWVAAVFAEGMPEEEAEPVQVPAGEYDFSTREGTIRAIIAECLKQGLTVPAQIAYTLATVEWESARTFRPVKEAYWKTEEWRRMQLYRYYPYYGRGYVQLTWKSNYEKYAKITGLDLVNNPDLALEPDTALFILVHGMRTGAFTGKKLADYINAEEVDFYNARRVVNGVDNANAIAALAEKYMQEL